MMRTISTLRSALFSSLLVAACVGCGSEASSGGGAGNPGVAGASGSAAGGAAAQGGAGGAISAGASSSGAGSAGASAQGGGGANAGSGGASAGSPGSAGSAGSGGSGGAPTATGKTEYAPYYEIYADTAAFTSLVDLKAKSGLNAVTLAFVLAGNGCSVDSTVSENLDDIHAFVAGGGHVKASFGGALGAYVESKCNDAAALASAMSKFVDETGITDLDFDIEQDPMLTSAKNTQRGQALKMLQDSKHVQVSFTLAVDDSGLPSKPLSCLTSALSAGVKVSHVNLMVMDYGDMPTGTPIAPIAIKSLNAAHAQLKKAITGLTDEQAWAMLGATPDIGQNDDNEIFTLADAQALTDFAIEKKLGLIAFWNIQRDQTCGFGECSEHDKAHFDYHNIFKKVVK